MIKAYFEMFADNCFILKTADTNSVLKPYTKKQALKIVDNKEAFLTNFKEFLYNPGKKSAAAETKHLDKLKKAYNSYIQFYDGKRTIASAIKVSNIIENHLDVQTHKLTKKTAADNTSFKSYELLDTPNYEYILIGSFLGKKVELRVCKDIFNDVTAPITRVFKLNGM